MVIKRDSDNNLMHIFYQKPTHSGTYLHFDSHCALSIKINIIKTEAYRIKKNCSRQDDIWPFLEKLRNDLTNSGYPEHLINSNILKGIQGNRYKENPQKPTYDHVLKLPYINEGFTRIVKKIIKKSEINARVVVTSGRDVKSLIKPNKPKFCESPGCILCTNEIPCKSKNYVYKFTCNHCKDKNDVKDKFYIGASRKVTVKRLKQHEASVRRYNNRTTLGQHMMEAHKDLKPPSFKNKVNFQNLFTHYKPEVIRYGKDCLDTFLKEGMEIKYQKPKLNQMMTNGFIGYR